MDWTDILRCPKTGNSLQLDEATSLVRVEHSDVTYPIIEGIVDFCPESHDRIYASYDRVASRYAPHITASSVLSKPMPPTARHEAPEKCGECL